MMILQESGSRVPDETIALLGLFTLLGWVFWLYTRARQKSLKDRVEFQTRVLSRFESSQELREFLQTRGGLVLLEAHQREGSSPVPLSRIMTAVQVGLFLCVLGIGLILVALLIGELEICIPGALLVMAGIGFFLSAAVTYWLSRRHGLLDSGGKPGRNNPQIEP